MHSSPAPDRVLGIDLGGTKLAGAVVSADGTLLHRTVRPLDGLSGRAVGALIGDLVSALLARSGDVRAIGVCIPGISWSSTGRVWAPNIPGWDDYPLRDELAGVLGTDGPRVAVDSDRACSVLGEAWLGAARGCTDAVFIAVGTGIGAGIMTNGTVLRGAQDIAGATGWMALDRPFRADYTRCGCFEYQASGDGLARMARELLARSPDYAGPLRTDGVLTAHEIFAAHGAGDPLALEVIRNAVECWGMAAANFVSLFNPEVVIFGGGVFGPALRLLGEIGREARRWAQPLAMERVRIVGSALGGDAALYGAASLALRSRISSGDPLP